MTIFCTNCGNELEDNSNFCTNCGTKVIPLVNTKKRKHGGFRDMLHEQENNYNEKKGSLFSKIKDKTDKARADALKREGSKGDIPRLSGIAEYQTDAIVIRKTGEIIPITEINNFSLHQSSQSLWSDVKVDFDYNGKHYRTQVAGTEKGKLQTIEKKINAIEMSKFTNSINTNDNNTANNDSNGEKSKVEKLRGIKELLDEGIINEEEFKELKAEIINE